MFFISPLCRATKTFDIQCMSPINRVYKIVSMVNRVIFISVVCKFDYVVSTRTIGKNSCAYYYVFFNRIYQYFTCTYLNSSCVVLFSYKHVLVNFFNFSRISDFCISFIWHSYHHTHTHFVYNYSNQTDVDSPAQQHIKRKIIAKDSLLFSNQITFTQAEFIFP